LCVCVGGGLILHSAVELKQIWITRIWNSTIKNILMKSHFMHKVWNNANGKKLLYIYSYEKLVVFNYVRSSGMHPRIKCDCTVHVSCWMKSMSEGKHPWRCLTTHKGQCHPNTGKNITFHSELWKLQNYTAACYQGNKFSALNMCKPVSSTLWKYIAGNKWTAFCI
jgi:hypothetical protein